MECDRQRETGNEENESYMIDKRSRSKEWIEEMASANRVSDAALMEKTIRAFCLLEALARSGCPFIFKGGSALMLHLKCTKRLSIDIDIICPPGTRIEEYLGKYAEEYGFGEVQLVERIQRTDVPKQHAKFYYQVAYREAQKPDKILLDVLFEDTHYHEVERLPIDSPILIQDGEPVIVNVPSKKDLLGDKMTAFAPHTTGIPFWKGEKNCSMEIVKQLFDVASLFDMMEDVTEVSEVFKRLAVIEMQYRRQEQPEVLEPIYEDIVQTCLAISLRGAYGDAEEFRWLQDGISRIQSFILNGPYRIEQAVVCAAKAAYLSRLVMRGETKVVHYDPKTELTKETIGEPLPSKLNRLRKQNPEAFFYWQKTSELMG